MTKATIKLGAVIYQDGHRFRWPSCFPRNGKLDNEHSYECKQYNTEFTVSKSPLNPELCVCVADGFGAMPPNGKYGSGSITTEEDNLIITGENNG